MSLQLNQLLTHTRLPPRRYRCVQFSQKFIYINFVQRFFAEFSCCIAMTFNDIKCDFEFRFKQVLLSAANLTPRSLLAHR